MDTETMGLGMEDEIWWFAGIRREITGETWYLDLFLEHDESKVTNLPPKFQELYHEVWDPTMAVPRAKAAVAINHMLSDNCHVVGSNPAFDIYRIERQLYEPSQLKSDHNYHLLDIGPMLLAHLANGPEAYRLTLPYSTDTLCDLARVQRPDGTRHTAMTDAEWALACFDTVIGRRNDGR
jgi:hypothetical protein